MALISEVEEAKAEALTSIFPRFDTNPPSLIFPISIPAAEPVVFEPLPMTLIVPSDVFVIVPDRSFSTNIPLDKTASILIVPLFVILPSTSPAFTPKPNAETVCADALISIVPLLEIDPLSPIVFATTPARDAEV